MARVRLLDKKINNCTSFYPLPNNNIVGQGIIFVLGDWQGGAQCPKLRVKGPKKTVHRRKYDQNPPVR